MAPQYAPSLRARLPPAAILLQIIFIVIFALFVDYKKDDLSINSYSKFQDVHVMIFLGFGFLSTCLVRYGLSSSAFNLLVGAATVQWATILNGFLDSKWKILLNMNSLVDAELCLASALVAMGANHGKINPVQLLAFSLLEVTGFILNQRLIDILYKTQAHQRHGITLLHIFGALFGIISSWVLYRGKMVPKHEKEKFCKKTGLFAMLGTLFLWMFWPSFNSVLVKDSSVVVGSTYLSMAVSAVTAAIVSIISSPKGKFNLVVIQSSMLAGGVAVSAILTTPHVPWIAMSVGLCATVLSTLGVQYMKDHMLFAFECHDTCSVLSVHAVPGIMGWFVQLLLCCFSMNNATIAVRFAVCHISILMITITMSLVTGLITGILLKWNLFKPQQDRKCFDDQAFWKFPHNVVHK